MLFAISMLQNFLWISFLLGVGAFPTASIDHGAAITPAPSLAHAADHLERRYDPLSHLISEGVAVGNSILSGVLSPNTPSASSVTSQAPVSSTETPTSSPASNPSSPAQPTAPVSTPSDTSGSGSTTDKNLVIILAVIISLLVITAVVLLVWLCLRRRRRRRQSNDDKYDVPVGSPKVPALRVQSQGLWEESVDMRHHTIPPPPSNLLRSSRERDEDTRQSSGSDAHSTTPFLTPPLARDGTATYVSQDSNDSSELDGTPISPVTAVEPPPAFAPSPAEIDSTNVPWIPRKSSRRQSKQFHYPSHEESSRFDFGFGREPARDDGKRHGLFKIPRRPVTG